MKTLIAAAGLALAGPALAAPAPQDWEAVLDAARGQTVFWHAWGGSTRTNEFIAWVGDRMAERHGITLNQVKLSDTADAVSRVLAEKSAGKDSDGAVDLVWINGENFAAMKKNDLLFGPFAEALPNWQYVDAAGKPVRTDFTVPTDGLESPWSATQVVFYYDSARLSDPPKTMGALLDWTEEHPGRFTYPQPPDFLGSTFLKQVLYAVTDDPAVLQKPVAEADYAGVTAPLWDYLDKLTPNLWRSGRAYPQSGPRQIQLMADGEIDLAISLSPGEASAAIATNRLPGSVDTFVMTGGSIGNVSFVAIPYNASSKAGAMVVANFLLSPEAQARAQDPDVLGYGTVLDLEKLPEADRAPFEELELGAATLPPGERGETLPEPHPSWLERIEAGWIERYGTG